MRRRQAQCSLGDAVGLPDSARQSWDCGSELQMWIRGVIHPQTKPLAPIPWYPFFWGYNRLQPPPLVPSVLEAEPSLGDGV